MGCTVYGCCGYSLRVGCMVIGIAQMVLGASLVAIVASGAITSARKSEKEAQESGQFLEEIEELFKEFQDVAKDTLEPFSDLLNTENGQAFQQQLNTARNFNRAILAVAWLSATVYTMQIVSGVVLICGALLDSWQIVKSWTTFSKLSLVIIMVLNTVDATLNFARHHTWSGVQAIAIILIYGGLQVYFLAVTRSYYKQKRKRKHTNQTQRVVYAQINGRPTDHPASDAEPVV